MPCGKDTGRQDAQGCHWDASGTLSPSTCEDVTQPETADVAGPPQAAAVEEHRHRKRFARHLTQLRAQGGRGRDGQVRGVHNGELFLYRANANDIAPVDCGEGGGSAQWMTVSRA